ncbi:MAG: hypothetical protein SWZ49_00995, partial [Cyanobacteriota bacterium]|nr:hypothetical protein [Cyanobacteriota bacterium]
MASLKLYSNGDSELNVTIEVKSFDGPFDAWWDIITGGDGQEEEISFTSSFIPGVENVLTQYLDDDKTDTYYFIAGNGSGSYVESTYNRNDYILVFDLEDYGTIFDSNQVLDMDLDFSSGSLKNNLDDDDEEEILANYSENKLDENNVQDYYLEYLEDDDGEGKYFVVRPDGDLTDYEFKEIKPAPYLNAFYGYVTTDTSSTYLDYPDSSFSGDDQIIGSSAIDAIWAGHGDDVISGSDTDDDYGSIGDYTIVIEDSSNEDSTTIAFESSGADFLFANEGSDLIYGGQGDTVISGGDGEDVIYESVYGEDENHIFGGEGIDTFIINADPSSGDESESESDFYDFAYDNILTDLSDLFFATLKSFKIAGGYGLEFLKETFPAFKDILDEYVFGVETSTANPTSTQTSTVIYDFDPTEDILIIYHDDEDTVAFDTAGDIYNGLPGITLKNGDDELLVHLAGDFFNDDTDAKDDLSAQYVNNAIYVEKVGGEYQIRQGGNTYSEEDFDDFSFSDLGITDYGSGFFIVGAFGPQTVFGTDDTDGIYGTKEYGDVLYGYSFGNADTDDEDEIFGYGGDDWLDGGEGDDELYGGDGNDTAFFIGATEGVYADLSDVSVDADDEEYATAKDGLPESSDGVQGLDKLYSIENLSGGSFDDTLIGDDNANTLEGLEGDDVLSGGGGDDTLDGGEGNNILDGGDDYDTVDYSDTGSAITLTIDDETISVDDGNGRVDTLTNIEEIIFAGSDEDTIVVSGDAYTDYVSFDSILSTLSDNNISLSSSIQSFYADSTEIVGTDDSEIIEAGASDNQIDAGNGDDTLIGGEGNDSFEGGDGTDIIDYSSSTSGIIANVEEFTISDDGLGGSDTLTIDTAGRIDIEGIIGSNYADDITVGHPILMEEFSVTAGAGDDT